MLQAVGVAVDNALYAFALGVGPQAPVQVEAIWVRVQCDPGACFCAGVNHGALVHFVRLTLQEQPAREMAEHGDVRVLRQSG